MSDGRGIHRAAEDLDRQDSEIRAAREGGITVVLAAADTAGAAIADCGKFLLKPGFTPGFLHRA